MADCADVINMPLDCGIRLDPQSVPAPKAFGVNEAPNLFGKPMPRVS
ncbi:MAG: hypothetical protein ABSA97_01495 [Verrucomicrobiia bacterium]